MYPKARIQHLNLRRELGRRLRFVKRRIPETIIEFQFFQGALLTLPEDMGVPPHWAKNAAVLAWKGGFGAIFDRLTPDYISKNPRAAVREVMAIQENLIAYISSPALNTQLSEIGDSELNGIKKEFGAISKLLLHHLRKLNERVDELLPPSTHAELLQENARALKVTRALAANDRPVLGAKTLAAEICYVVWFFWPEWETKEGMTARDLHHWLSSTLGIHASEKTVEAVFTKIQMSAKKK